MTNKENFQKIIDGQNLSDETKKKLLELFEVSNEEGKKYLFSEMSENSS